MTNQLIFKNTVLQTIHQNNKIWLPSTELAKALDYARPDSVTRIYERNSEEFTPEMTETVKLTVSGNCLKTQRLFSLRGAHLIALFAKTAVAKEFRKWVLDLLDNEANQKSLPVVNRSTVEPLHPTVIPCQFPSVTVVFNREEITILNAIFGSIDYLDKKFFPYIRELFPDVTKDFDSAFNGIRIFRSTIKAKQQEIAEKAAIINGK